jgi:hypothetical protein
MIFGASYLLFADWTGLEPATSAVTGRHSNQLNYQSVLTPCGINRAAKVIYFFKSAIKF